jgi:hypothetical protein
VQIHSLADLDAFASWLDQRLEEQARQLPPHRQEQLATALLQLAVERLFAERGIAGTAQLLYGIADSVAVGRLPGVQRHAAH